MKIKIIAFNFKMFGTAGLDSVISEMNKFDTETHYIGVLCDEVEIVKSIEV